MLIDLKKGLEATRLVSSYLKLLFSRFYIKENWLESCTFWRKIHQFNKLSKLTKLTISKYI